MDNEVILYNNEKKCWELKNKKMPTIGKGESLIKIEFAGLCGSDMHRIKAPTICQSEVVMGHEIVGTVEKSDNKKLLAKRVIVNPIGNCGKCSNCVKGLSQFCEKSINIGKNVDGAFSKYLKVRNECIYLVPNSLKAELGVLADGIAVAINAIRKLSRQPKSALIIGDGAVGCLMVAVLKSLIPNIKISLKGKHNTDYIRKTYNLATELDEQYELSVETVGRQQSDTLNECVSKTSFGGQILVMGVYPPDFFLSFDVRTAFYKELSIYGVNSFCISDKCNDFAEAISLLNNHQELFIPLITHYYDLKDFDLGVEKMLNKTNENTIKVVYKPNGAFE